MVRYHLTGAQPVTTRYIMYILPRNVSSSQEIYIKHLIWGTLKNYILKNYIQFRIRFCTHLRVINELFLTPFMTQF